MTLPTTFAEMVQFDRDSVALNLAECGVSVTQYPKGNTGSPQNATALIGGKGNPHEDRSSGKTNVRPLELWCADSVAMDATDQWLVQGELYQVVSWDNDVGGWNHIILKIVETTLRSGKTTLIGGI